MRRWLVNFLAGFSLLLCIAMTVLWVRSYWNLEQVSRTSYGEQRIWIVQAFKGEMTVSLLRQTIPDNLPTGWSYVAASEFLITQKGDWPWPEEFLSTRTSRQLCGIRYARGITGIGPIPGTFMRLSLPIWLLVLITAVWPMYLHVSRFCQRRLAAKREMLNLCHNCGYDLRASKGRCPECGTVAKNE